MHTHQVMANNASSPSSPHSSYNSSYGSNSGQKLINSTNNSNSSPIAALIPGGVVTTQNISTVIRPKSNNNSLQFVKIQTPELSKTAVEQIKLAEETKISKDKVKEVEEEWQNNLLNWKSKRRQQITQTFEQAPNDPFDTTDSASGRKIKTFAEMIEQRAKSGNRLGFHLQRYLGSEDDEAEVSQNAAHDISYHSGPDHSKLIADSDCEIHSSTSSSYNQLDSKDSSSPETPVEHKVTSEVLISPRQTFPKCDSVSSNSPRDKQHDQNISLLEGAQATQLNSTLKQDMESPLPPALPPHLNRLSPAKTPYEGHTKKIEISTKSEGESDELGSEEEEDEQEEEEEEQKHLQRIAFEAKLKAFEKLTNASVSKPVVAPKRLIKPPINPPIIRPKHQQISPPPSPPQQPKKQPSCPAPPIFDDRNDLKLGSPIAKDDRLRGDVAPLVSPVNKRGSLSSNDQIISELHHLSLDHKPQINNNNNNTNINNNHGSSNNNNNLSPSDYFSSIDKPPLPQHFLDATSPPNECLSPKKDHPLGIRNGEFSDTHNTTKPDLPSHDSFPTKTIGNNTGFSQQNQNHTFTQDSNLNNLMPSPRGIANDAISPRRNSLHQDLMVNQRSNITQPIPEVVKNSPDLRKPVKKDKDRSILSVSGKKQCSSCKEELGRGAAAFVVESLSLVYHTNCFRCSVCHVNLANGFRGVDVRVHANALHCQNCYSKDGLNYSRV